MDGDDDRADRFDLGDLVRRWRGEGDVEALRVAAQNVLLTAFDLSGPRTREAFDEMRAELGRLFLAASLGGGDERTPARHLLASLLMPDSRPASAHRLAVTQRNAIVASYLSGVDEPEDRAERMAELENRILPDLQAKPRVAGRREHRP